MSYNTSRRRRLGEPASSEVCEQRLLLSGIYPEVDPRADYAQASRIFTCEALPTFTPFAGASAAATPDARTLTDALWAQTVTPYLQADLWNDRDAYDATNYLLVPLESAFQQADAGRLLEFAVHFRRFARAGAEGITGRLNRLQYDYLAARFVGNAAAAGRLDLVPAELVRLLEREVTRFWSVEPAWQWGRDPFPNMRVRLAWKLAHTTTPVSYYRAVVDEELHLLAIASELASFRRVTAPQTAPSSETLAIRATLSQLLHQEILPQPDGGWVLQPGVWTDHRDYQYAGWPEVLPNLPPNPVAGIAPDAGHFHRWPAWLESFERGFPPRSEPARWTAALRDGLRTQFTQHVLVAPTAPFAGWRTTNYMDGSNGVHRYGYSTLGEFAGYGPYEKSGNLLLGWWSLLGGTVMAQTYNDLAGMFPIPPDLRPTYVGPLTSRLQHPLVAASFDNGLRELLAALGSELAARRI